MLPHQSPVLPSPASLRCHTQMAHILISEPTGTRPQAPEKQPQATLTTDSLTQILSAAFPPPAGSSWASTLLFCPDEGPSSMSFSCISSSNSSHPSHFHRTVTIYLWIPNSLNCSRAPQLLGPGSASKGFPLIHMARSVPGLRNQDHLFPQCLSQHVLLSLS